MDLYGVIYKTTNLINSKIYIGKTTRQDPNYFGSGKIIKRAINKYGIDKFKKEIICECCNQKELNKKEKYWIAYFRSICFCTMYNVTDGGEGLSGYVHTEETKKKLSLLMSL